MNPNLDILTTKLGLHSDDNIDLRGLIYTLWESKLLILLLTLSCVLLATLYILITPPEYQANTLIKVETKNNGSLNLTGQLDLGIKQTDASMAQMALIHSRVVLEPVVKKLGLAIEVNPHCLPLIGCLLSNSNQDEKLIVSELNVPYSYFDKSLRLTIIDGTHYQLATTKGQTLIQGEIGELLSNPQGFSMRVTQLPAHPGGTFDIIKHTNSSVINQILSQLQVDELGDWHNHQTGILQISLKSTNPQQLVDILNSIVQVTQEKDGERKSLETSNILYFLSQQLPQVKASLEEAELALNHYRAASGKLDLKIETRQVLQQITNVDRQISGARLRKSELLQNFTVKHPFIIAADNKIKQLSSIRATLLKQVKVLPASDQIAVNLMRDVKVKNDLYLILLGKIQEMRVIKAGTLSDVNILAPATLPDEPVPKQIPVVILASLVLGILLGCVCVLIRKAFLSHINDPHLLEHQTNLPLFAIVPYSKKQAKIAKAFKTNETNSLEMLAALSPQDLSIEALRSLRTCLQMLFSELNNNNIITMLGISQNVGKSFLSANFACLLAEIGKRVLLIDGDMRKGHLHDYIKAKRGPGLSEVLAGANTLEEAIQGTPFDSLSFLSCGKYPKNPAELLMRPSFKELMSQVSRQFDLVLVDTAPVLAVTDCTIIGATAGLNLLIVAGNMHKTQEIKHALQRLETTGIKVNGTVFNNIKPTTTVYGNYQYKYYSEYA